MRGVRWAGRTCLAAGIAALVLIPLGLIAGSGASAAHSSEPADQQALTSLLQRLESEGQVADLGALKSLLAKIVSNQRQLTQLNQQLSTDQTEQQVLEVQLAGDRTALVSLVSTAYVDGNGPAEVAEALASPNMAQFFDQSTLPAAIASQVAQLVRSIERDRSSLALASAQLIADEASAQSVEKELGNQSDELLASLVHPTAEVITGDWAFAFGTCTYWAASQWRANGWDVNWGGDAYQWWANAAAAGHAEGSTPGVGAIVVWPPGVDGASWAGHVAYVVAVSVPGADYPDNFEVSEMNYYGAGGGFDQVDYRVVPDSGAGFDGFIYPPTGSS